MPSDVQVRAPDAPAERAHAGRAGSNFNLPRTVSTYNISDAIQSVVLRKSPNVSEPGKIGLLHYSQTEKRLVRDHITLSASIQIGP